MLSGTRACLVQQIWRNIDPCYSGAGPRMTGIAKIAGPARDVQNVPCPAWGVAAP